MPFDPSWDAGPRAQRTELQISPMTEDSADAGPNILVAPFNPSDAAALQRRLTNRWEEGLDLAGADLRRRDLSDFEEELVRANMQGADLSGARLTETQLPYANLRGADLTGADLRGADLTGADLYRACLYETDFAGAIMPNGARFKSPDDDESEEIAMLYSRP